MDPILSWFLLKVRFLNNISYLLKRNQILLSSRGVHQSKYVRHFFEPLKNYFNYRHLRGLYEYLQVESGVSHF